jgi:hypothetical protein
MMETWKKYAILITLVVIAVIPLTLLAVNFNGWGKQVSGWTGPFTNGAFKLGLIIPNFMVSSGYNMLIIYILAGILYPLLIAYVVWHFDVGYKFTGAAVAASPASGYDNTMRREPEEPERSQAP